MSETFNKVRLWSPIAVPQNQVTFAYIKAFILVTSVKLLSPTYLKVGLYAFIFVTETQAMAVICWKHKNRWSTRSDFQFSHWWWKPNIRRQLLLQLLLLPTLVTHMYYGLLLQRTNKSTYLDYNLHAQTLFVFHKYEYFKSLGEWRMVKSYLCTRDIRTSHILC